MRKKNVSWGIIVVWLILFFPVGLVLLCRKVSREKFERVANGKFLRRFGWVLFSFSVFYFLLAVTGHLQAEDRGNIVSGVLLIFIIFGGGGLLAVSRGNEMIYLGQKYYRYVSLVNASGDGSVEQIAAAYPAAFDQTVSDLQAMIRDGYFRDAYLDLAGKKLVLPKQKEEPAGTSFRQAVRCRNCGAPNTIVSGMAAECEYCGCPL